MTVIDRMPADDLATRIIDGPAGYAGVDGDEEWAAEVRRLADLRGATLLAHNYQLPAIQDVADHVGDSLALSRIAAEAPEDTIVFCGVHFMAETAKILSPGQDRADPRPAGRLLAGRLDHRRRAARLEGRASRRGRRLLRQHHRRGEGGDRHLLHVVERRRGGRVHPRGPRGAVLPRPVPRRARPAGHRPQEPARLGRRMPRARRHQRRRARRPGPRASRRRAVRAPRMRLRHFGFVPGRRGRVPRGPGQDPVHRRHARRRPRDPAPDRCWSPPRSACCTNCAAPHRKSTSAPSTTGHRAST